MKTGTGVGWAMVVLLGVGAVFYHQEVSDFIHAMQPNSMEATITFGKALDPSGRFVVDPATTFSLGENVAWVVHFQKNAGAKELIVSLSEIGPDGREIPLDRNKMTVAPTDIGLYNFTTTQAFWALSPKETGVNRHVYRVKYLKDRIIAQGDFAIVAKSPEQPPSDRSTKTPSFP
ncbi:MAG TPA: hypothetical protein VFH55_11000 [Nitrospiria bacterium]|nr:hypothetical protein [Nitrospiria bacterium]